MKEIFSDEARPPELPLESSRDKPSRDVKSGPKPGDGPTDGSMIFLLGK
jgi:hypothetical protein